MDFTQGTTSFPEDTYTVSSLASQTKQAHYRFADCFAGLGGFHVALSKLGHECVFACELDEELRAIYRRNFGILPAGDIRHVDATAMPAHEVLCAGFPCQPFSLAGKKKGAACPESGKLIDDVLRLARFHRPLYVLLENVPNVLTIAGGKFWNNICRSLARMGYIVENRIYSPLQFGVPQQRMRLFVVARRDDMPRFEWPNPPPTSPRPLSEFIGVASDSIRRIEPAKAMAIEKWSQLIAELPELTSDTLIASEFGATYPLDGLPARSPWRKYAGAFGAPLSDATDREEAIQHLPHYASNNGGSVPKWMRPYIETSRRTYRQAPKFFDQWKVGVEQMPNSWQKLEWRGDRTKPDLWKQTIQFRASGIRVMRPDMAPSLVAMTPTQTPIIGARRRYLGVREAASLQALDELNVFPENNERAFRALGNAVNAKIVYEIAKHVLC
jgi:DNA (cytosine-5)-methyltransferase 1